VDWVAISATHLVGVYLTGDPFGRFRDVAPSARAGYSILLYDTRRFEVRDALNAAAARKPTAFFSCD
jgi:hypothetical protein